LKNIQGVSKLNGKTSGMDSSYRETKTIVWQHGSGNVWLQSCPSVYLLSAHRHVLIVGINCKTLGTIVTPQGLYFLAVPWCLVDVQNSPVRIGSDRFLQMSFGLAIYTWGMFPIQATHLQSIIICQTMHVMHAHEFFVCVHYHFTADCKPHFNNHR
jgi:hypothetical protein